MIRLDRISKSFKGKPALEPLSLEIGQGEVFGLLGHNGAGKSTTFGLLLGHLRPTGGEAFVRGVSVQRDRSRALQRVGAIFETPAFYDYLSGWRNLNMITAYSHGRVSPAEMEETVRFVGLEKRIHDPVRVYSHGMRQRLALAQALLPCAGVGPAGRTRRRVGPREGIHEMRELIRRLNRERGLTVMLSSHLLAEVEQTCRRIAILNAGPAGFPGPLAGRSGRQKSALPVGGGRPGPKLAAAAVAAGSRLEPDGCTVALAEGRDVADLVAALVGAGARVRAVEPLRQNLEEIYLRTISAVGAPDASGAPGN